MGRTYVAVRAGEQTVRGYYSLASGAVALKPCPRRSANHPATGPGRSPGKAGGDQSARGNDSGRHSEARVAAMLDVFRIVGIYAGGVRLTMKPGLLPEVRVHLLADDERHLYPMKVVETFA
jgi:hypothetical protein